MESVKEEIMEDSSFCIFCCSPFCPKGKVRIKSEFSHEAPGQGAKTKKRPKENATYSQELAICMDPTFRHFCQLIESLSKPKNKNDRERKKNGKFSSEALLKSLAFFKRLAACTPCLKRLREWNEVRDRVRQREVEILRLQKEIAKELKALDRDLKPYKEHLEVIEETIKESEEDSLEQFLDGVIESERDLNGDDDESEGLLRKVPVIGFRKHALNAVKELNIFRRRLKSRVNPKLVPHKRLLLEDEDNSCSKSKKFKTADPGPSSTKMDYHGRVIKTEVEEDEVYQDDGDAELPNWGDYLSVEFQEENGSESESEPSSSRRPRPRRQRRASKRSTRYSFRRSYSSAKSGNSDSNSDDEVESNDEDPEDTDFLPIMEQKAKNKLRVVIPPAAKLEEQSEFKKSILKAVYHRIALRNSGKCPIPRHDRRYEYYVDYDPQRQVLFVRNVDIIINDQLQELQCSQCDYTTGKLKNMYLSKILDHIMGKHLGVFDCDQCPKKFSEFVLWKEHVRGHLIPFDCDVCGRPFTSSQGLDRHKWTHMNVDEVLDALSRGLKDPRLAKQERKATSSPIPCPECGKCFRGRSELRQHERNIHGDRSKGQCSQCGKLLAGNSLKYHMKYTCPNREQIEEEVVNKTCPRCPGQVFRTMLDYKRHQKQGHKPDKSGKANGINKSDLETQDQERPWRCQLGCGATFVQQTHCERHQTELCPVLLVEAWRTTDK